MKEQIEDGQQVALPIVESIGDKPYFTPIEAAILLGVGKTTNIGIWHKDSLKP